jgi:hypothetical protein
VGVDLTIRLTGRMDMSGPDAFGWLADRLCGDDGADRPDIEDSAKPGTAFDKPGQQMSSSVWPAK